MAVMNSTGITFQKKLLRWHICGAICSFNRVWKQTKAAANKSSDNKYIGSPRLRNTRGISHSELKRNRGMLLKATGNIVMLKSRERSSGAVRMGKPIHIAQKTRWNMTLKKRSDDILISKNGMVSRKNSASKRDSGPSGDKNRNFGDETTKKSAFALFPDQRAPNRRPPGFCPHTLRNRLSPTSKIRQSPFLWSANEQTTN